MLISICRVSKRDLMKSYRNISSQKIRPSSLARRSQRAALKNSIAKVCSINFSQRRCFKTISRLMCISFVCSPYADDSFSSTNSSRSTVTRTTTLNGHQSADDEPPLMRPVRTGRAKPACYVCIPFANNYIETSIIQY